MIKNIIIIILLLLIGFGAYNKFLLWNVDTKTKTKIKTVERIITVRDTIEIPAPKIVYRDKFSPIKLPIADTKLQRQSKDSIDVILPHHIYSDVIKKDSSTFSYNIEVDGFLRNFDYDFNVRTKYVTKIETVERIKNRFIDVHGIVGIARVPYVGIDVGLNKYKLGYRLEYYDRPIHHIELGYRFFGW